jgi:hypothetical protein
MRRRRTDRLVLTPELKKRTFSLPIEQTVYVPSTSGVQEQKTIPKKQFSKRVEDVRRYLSSRFGGYTSVEGVGGWLDTSKKGKGRVIKEDVVKVTSFSTRPAYRKYNKELIQQIGIWDKQWKQASVGYEQEGDLFYIGPPKKRMRRR